MQGSDCVRSRNIDPWVSLGGHIGNQQVTHRILLSFLKSFLLRVCPLMQYSSGGRQPRHRRRVPQLQKFRLRLRLRAVSGRQPRRPYFGPAGRARGGGRGGRGGGRAAGRRGRSGRDRRGATHFASSGGRLPPWGGASGWRGCGGAWCSSCPTWDGRKGCAAGGAVWAGSGAACGELRDACSYSAAVAFQAAPRSAVFLTVACVGHRVLHLSPRPGDRRVPAGSQPTTVGADMFLHCGAARPYVCRALRRRRWTSRRRACAPLRVRCCRPSRKVGPSGNDKALNTPIAIA